MIATNGGRVVLRTAIYDGRVQLGIDIFDGGVLHRIAMCYGIIRLKITILDVEYCLS